MSDKNNGYQPVSTGTKNPTPPNCGSHVKSEKYGYNACLKELNDANEKVVYLSCRFSKAVEIIEELINCVEAEDVDYNIINPAKEFLREVK